MTSVLVHLSDIHIKSSSDPILTRAQKIASTTFKFLPTANHVVILVSGDIAYSGKASQYELARKFLQDIRSFILAEMAIPVTFVIAPGNHDCDFAQSNAARNILVSKLTGPQPPDIDQSVIDACTGVQSAFFAFRDALETHSTMNDDKLWRTHNIDIDARTILFDVVNVSWASQLNEEPGHLFFPIDRYSEKRNQTVPSGVRIVVMHHPLNWYGQSIYRPFRIFIRQLAHILITGHEHQGNVGFNQDVESDKSAYVEGRLLQTQDKPFDSSFNMIVLDLGTSQFSSTAYSWTGNCYESNERESWSDYRELPAKERNSFQIEKSFEEILDDPGAFLTNSSKANICLADVYVYPDLKSMGIDDRREYTNASKLLRPEFTLNGVLIAGEEKAGRTSLLFQLYREYHDRGFVPLLVNGKDLKKGTEHDIRNAIKHAVEIQYGHAQVTPFEQLFKERKLLLIDDLDDAQTKAAAARSNLIRALQKRFGHLVGTVNEMFEIRECLEAANEVEPLSLDVYHLQEFNYSRRSDLIEKWFNLGTDVTTDKGTLLERCDRAERLINIVMQRRLIPAAPLYLLALLQSVDVGRGGDFKDSALGYFDRGVSAVRRQI